ncbi:MAG TPA: hypothetical protein VGU24_10915 [Microvirga sp.]|jgi:hypothetical protein|nr:hypothetical protein [Microvirga sp.]
MRAAVDPRQDRGCSIFNAVADGGQDFMPEGEMSGGTNINVPEIDIGFLGDPGIEMGEGDGIAAEQGTPFVEDGDPVLIIPPNEEPTGNVRLSDAELDDLNSGQGDWSGAVVRIQRHLGSTDLGPNTDALFGFDFNGTALTTAGNAIFHSGDEIATFSNANGVFSINFGGDVPVSTSLANLVVSRVTYANTSENTSLVEFAYTVFDGNPDDPNTLSSASAYIQVDIVEKNDAPSIAASDTISVVANGQTVIKGIAFADPDVGVLDVTLTVTLTVTSGTLAGGESYGVDVSGPGPSITLQGSLNDINTYLAGGFLSFTNPGSSNASLTIHVSDNGTISDDPIDVLQATKVVTLDVNTRPVLDPSKEPSLAAVVEDSSASTIGSTSVSDLIGTSGIANYSDLDGDSPGLAITGVSSKGTLHYSTDGGSTWQELSTPPSESSALLLSATAHVFFKPNAHFNGSIADAITFKAWD